MDNENTVENALAKWGTIVSVFLGLALVVIGISLRNSENADSSKGIAAYYKDVPLTESHTLDWSQEHELRKKVAHAD